MTDDTMQQCVAYFRERTVYGKLFSKFRDKYASLGHLGGTVQLGRLQPDECLHLGGFFQKDYTGKKTITISYTAMEKALQNSRFAGLDWEDILREYFGEELCVKKEQRLAELEQREQYFLRVIQEANCGRKSPNPGCIWLEQTLQTKGEGYLLLAKQYKEGPEQLRRLLLQFLNAVPKLPFLSTASGSAYGYRDDMQGVDLQAALCGQEKQGVDGGNAAHLQACDGCGQGKQDDEKSVDPECDRASQGRKKELLAVFAAEHTGDPHFFDVGTLGEQLLTAFLKAGLRGQGAVGLQDGEVGEECSDSVSPGLAAPSQAKTGLTDSGPADGVIRTTDSGQDAGTVWENTAFPAERKAELFYRAGLLKDDLSNHTLAYGIHAWKEAGGLHEGIEGFLHCREPVQLTLMTLSGLKKVCTQTEKTVYIVENPAVFSSLVRAWPEAAVICGNGQIRLATLVLMDLFDKATIFYYAGDFDPEGLQIAQRLKERYGSRLQLWNYRREYYEVYRSHVQIPQKSLKKLDKIYRKELEEIKTALMEYRVAAYQEAMLREYLGDSVCRRR